MNSDGSVTIEGLRAKDEISYATLGDHNRVKIHNTGDDATNLDRDIGGFKLLDAGIESLDVGPALLIEDDGPSVDLVLNGAAELRLDETDNDADDSNVGGILATNTLAATAYLTTNTASFGSDGEAGTSPTIWSLLLTGATNDSGLNDTVSDTNVLLFLEGTSIVGRAGSNVGAVVFTASINATTGALTVVQDRAVEHDDPADKDESGLSSAVMNSGLIAVKRTVTDGDGDSASDSVDISQIIKFEDDGPTNFTPAAITLEDNVKNQPGASATNIDLTNSLSTTVVANHSGSDGFGSIKFTGGEPAPALTLLQGTIGNGSLQNLTSDGNPIYLFGFGTGVLTATTDATNASLLDRVFTITLNSGTDSYDFNMLGQIDNNAASLFVDFAGQKQTIYEWLTLDLPTDDPGDADGPDAGNTIDPAERDGDILFTGILRNSVGEITTFAGTNAEINVSSTGIGVENQTIGPREGVFIDFVDGAPRTLDGQAPIADLDFAALDHVTVNDAGFGVSQLKPNKNTVTDVRVSVYNETQGDPDTGTNIANDTPLNIESVTIRVDANKDGVFDANAGELFTFLESVDP